MSDHWAHLSSLWNDMGAPLRPTPYDVRRIVKGLGIAASEGNDMPPHRALLLGVTPELLSGVLDGDIVAVDRSPEMLGFARQHSLAEQVTLVEADWRNLPFERESFGWVLGDGCFPSLGNQYQMTLALGEVFRVLRPGGTFSQRYFVQRLDRFGCTQGETIEQIRSDADLGRTRNFHEVKLRVLLSLAARSPYGEVALAEARQVIHDELPLEKFDPAHVATIDAYERSAARYHFPTEQQLLCALRAAGFALRSVVWPGYSVGGSCPIVAAMKPFDRLVGDPKIVHPKTPP